MESEREARQQEDDLSVKDAVGHVMSENSRLVKAQVVWWLSLLASVGVAGGILYFMVMLLV